MDNIIAERVANVTLTKSQRKIADYFILNPEEVGLSSSMEIANRIGVSDSSITRFARAIGYEGFLDLKNDLYNNMARAATGSINSLSMTERFNANQARFGGQESIEVFEQVTRRAMEVTIRQNADGQIDRVVSSILAAKHRYVYGCRGTGGVVYQCSWLWRFLLDHVIAVSNEGPGGIGLLQDASSEDCALLFSVARLYKTDLDAAQLIHSRGAKLCLVTSSFTSPLAPLADEVILVETAHMSFFNSMIAMHFLTEYMTYLISQRKGDVYREKARERDEYTEFLRMDK